MDDLIIKEGLLSIRRQYEWWLGSLMATHTEKEMAQEKIIRIDRVLKELKTNSQEESIS